MKKTIQILILGFIFINGYGQKNKIQTETFYYDLQKTVISSEKSFYKSGRKQILHGDFKEYYRNGQLMTKKTYDNGVLTGAWIEYYESGQVLLESKYLKGKCNGDYKKYYENGAMMIEAKCQNDKLEVLRYGFPDGKYAIKKVSQDSTSYYELFDKSGLKVENTNSDFKKLEQSTYTNCKIVAEFRYPELLIEKQLEGLVILKLTIDINGRLKNVEPLAGFHEEAIKESVMSINKNGCYEIKYKDNTPIEYNMIIPIIYQII